MDDPLMKIETKIYLYHESNQKSSQKKKSEPLGNARDHSLESIIVGIKKTRPR